MNQLLTTEPNPIDIDNLIQDDDTPLDSFLNEKQQRLLTAIYDH